jgi:hypothetical protein
VNEWLKTPFRFFAMIEVAGNFLFAPIQQHEKILVPIAWRELKSRNYGRPSQWLAAGLPPLQVPVTPISKLIKRFCSRTQCAFRRLLDRLSHEDRVSAPPRQTVRNDLGYLADLFRINTKAAAVM